MARLGTTRATNNDNPFTIDYHRRGAAASSAGSRKRRRFDAEFGDDTNEDIARDTTHPISRNGSMLLGAGAVGCDWNDHVVLPDAKSVDITSKQIVFSYRAHDINKEVYVKNIAVMVRNIMFKINLSYTLIYKEPNNYEAIVSSFTVSDASNSQGKFIKLSLSTIARQDIIMAVLDLSAKQIKDRSCASDSIKNTTDNLESEDPITDYDGSDSNELMAG